MNKQFFDDTYEISESAHDALFQCLDILKNNIDDVLSGRYEIDALELLEYAKLSAINANLNHVIKNIEELITNIEFLNTSNFEDDFKRIYLELNRSRFEQHIKKERSISEIFFLDLDDRARVMGLITEMRHIVHQSATFDDAHRRRILKRLAKIEDEVLKAQGNFDTILAGIAEIGETLGQFGKDVKPLTDRMQEIRKITQRSTKNADQLPAPEEPRKLPPPEDDGEGNDEDGVDGEEE